MAEIKGSTVSIVDTLDVAGHLEHVFMAAVERLSTILKTITIIAGDSELIADLARHGGEAADDLHNDIDVLREELSRGLGTVPMHGTPPTDNDLHIAIPIQSNPDALPAYPRDETEMA